MLQRISTCMACIFILFLSEVKSQENKIYKLPEGMQGIASGYPGDRNINKNPDVIFADDFENYSNITELTEKWDVLINEEYLNIETHSGLEDGKNKSLQFTIPKRDKPLATGVAKELSKTRDVLFLRWYMKYEKDWFVPSGSVHNGASISSKYFENGNATPGIKSNGHNKFLVNFENENSRGASPGNLNVYVYWPEQGDIWGDHFFPSGLVLPHSNSRSGENTFGKQFKPLPDFSPKPNRWYCYEYMVKVNTPNKRDGRIAMWLDGNLVADFQNLRLRDTEKLKIDRFGLDLYIAGNKSRTNRKWHDNVVAATSYIGPVSETKK